MNERRKSHEIKKNDLLFIYFKMIIHCFHFIFILECINFKNSQNEAYLDNMFFIPIGYAFNMIPFQCLFEGKLFLYFF